MKNFLVKCATVIRDTYVKKFHNITTVFIAQLIVVSTVFTLFPQSMVYVLLAGGLTFLIIVLVNSLRKKNRTNPDYWYGYNDK